MVIEYQIKRFDLVKSYFISLRHSSRTQLIVFGAAAFIIIYSLYNRYNSHGHLVLFDFMTAFLLGLGLILIVPAAGFLTAKTQKRTLSISPDGIATKIGSKAGKVSWKAVDSIIVEKDHIFITGKSGDAFIIPSSAFTSEDLCNQFIDLAKQYHRGV